MKKLTAALVAAGIAGGGMAALAVQQSVQADRREAAILAEAARTLAADDSESDCYNEVRKLPYWSTSQHLALKGNCEARFYLDKRQRHREEARQRLYP